MKKNLVFAFCAGIMLYPSLCPAQVEHYGSIEEQRKAEQTYEKRKILRKAEMQTDTSREFITVPSDYPEIKDFDVAQIQPTIDFAIVQGLDPFYVSPIDGGVYGGWGDVTKGPDNCFYFSIGNHQSYGGTAYIIRYDPATKIQSIVVDSKKVVNWSDDEYGDGKFHGDPDIGPGGDMWLLTFYGPRPTKEELDAIYDGSWLIKYNIFTGETENLGIPIEGESWPYHSYDWERGVLFGIGAINGYVMAYDTKARKMLYGGAPPNGISWYNRAVLLDRETGIFYTTNFKAPHKFVSYERRNNKFTIMRAEVPPNPVTGKSSLLRAYTKKKDADGAFWCFSYDGTFFKFYPDEDRVELVGINWGNEGKYIANMCLSPKKRYIYYVIDAATHGDICGTPVVQYDTHTGRKKVIAFLKDFYHDKYGYNPGGTYGVELDEKGESIFFYTNGRFTSQDQESWYGRPAIFHVHIPESERIE